MGRSSTRLATRLALGASMLALAGYPMIAAAQDTSSTMGNPGPSTIQDSPATTDATKTQSTGVADGTDASGGEIVVTGIRASLR